MDLLHNLNDSQRSAVTTTEGAVLVVAGPGTGKTLTIVHRIAYLINQGVSPENILCVTFTNRAASEMTHRAGSLLENYSISPFIGTFHSLGIRLIGDIYPESFVIYNRDEQAELLRTVLTDSDLSGSSERKVSLISERISRIKNLLEDKDEEIKEIYEKYQSALESNSAMDFDDLILKPIEILSNNNILERYSKRFRYIIVDEYQDINPAQYRLLRLLAGGSGNICAVGDPDQAIYAFRGAHVEHFLNFERDFSGARRILLTENHRSTMVVLNASDSLIRNNLKRIPKELRPLRDTGNPITVISVPDEKAEAEVIVKEIEKRIGGTSHYQMRHLETFSGGSYSFSDFAVLFRTNAQAKAIEETFITSGIPYQVIGGVHLLKKKEIMDTLTLLRVLVNPMDEVNLKRLINMPWVRLSKKAVSGALNYAKKDGLSLYEAIKAYDDNTLREFITMMENLKDLKKRLMVDELLKIIIEKSGLGEYYRESENFLLLENLATSCRDIEPSEALIRFINEVSLMTPADVFDPRAQATALMTMHMAKGLEFRVVFIAGLEDGLIPYTLNKDDTDIEEERRLFYVGMTRAKDELFLIHARKRLLYGQRSVLSPSAFLDEIPQEFKEDVFVPDRIRKQKKEDPQAGLF